MSEQFTPSGFTGQGEEPEVLKLHFDACPERAPGALGICYTFEFRPREDLEAKWVSVVWQSPANNWGRLPPKTIEGGGKRVRFKVRGSRPGWIFKVGVGGVMSTFADGKPYPYQDVLRDENGDVVTDDKGNPKPRVVESLGRAGPTGATHFPFTADAWTEYAIELDEDFDADEFTLIKAFEWVYDLSSPGPDKNSPTTFDPITIYIDDIVWE